MRISYLVVLSLMITSVTTLAQSPGKVHYRKPALAAAMVPMAFPTITSLTATTSESEASTLEGQKKSKANLQRSKQTPKKK